MMRRFNRLRTNVGGATSIEYGIVVGLLGCGIMVSVSALGGNLGAAFSAVAGGLGGSGTAVTAPPPNNTNHFNG